MSNVHHSQSFHVTTNRGIKKCRQLITVGIFMFATTVLSPFVIAMELDEAVNKVQSELGGKVLDIQNVTVHHSPAYRIKLLQPSGRVKVLLLDANTGEFLSDASDPDKQ